MWDREGRWGVWDLLWEAGPEGLDEKVTCKQRSEGGEGGAHTQMWGKSNPNTGKDKCKDPEAGAGIARASEVAERGRGQ